MTQSGGNFLDDLLLGVQSNGVSGTGFWHSTSGVLDTAARAVNLSTDTTGVLPLTDLAQNGASTNQAMIWTGTQWAPGNAAVLPINLAGGSADVIGVLPAANQAAQTMAGDVTGTTAANVVTSLTGSAGVVTVPSATHLAFPDASAHLAASGRIRLANGDAIVSRNAGNTLDANIVGFDSGATLSIGQAAGTGVAVVSIQGNSTQLYFGSGASYFDSGALHFRGSGHAANLILDADSAPTAPTFGTGTAGHSLVLQADAATTIQTLASTGTELANLSTPAAGTGPRLVGASGRFEVVDSDGTVRIF